MSLIKREIEKNEEYRKITFDILIEIGAIKTCDFHDDFYFVAYSVDKKEIYARATDKLKKQKGEENIDFKLFHSLIDEILSEAADGPDGCPYCSKFYKD